MHALPHDSYLSKTGIRISRLAAAVLVLSLCGAGAAAQNAGGAFALCDAVVESVQWVKYPVVRVALKDVKWPGGAAKDPSKLTAESFPGSHSTPETRPPTESGEAPWYLRPGDRVKVVLWRQWGSDKWYMGRTERTGAGSGSPPVNIPPTVVPPLKLSLEAVPNPAQVGQTVNMAFSVKNVSQKPFSYRTTSGQQFEIQAADSAGRKVWNWSHGRFFIAAILNETVKPGETRTFRAQWDLKDNSGKKLAAGKYRVSAWLMTGGKDQPAAPPVDLLVK